MFRDKGAQFCVICAILKVQYLNTKSQCADSIPTIYVHWRILKNYILLFQELPDLESQEFLERCKQYIATQTPLAECEIIRIEQETRGQASNPKWFQHRTGEEFFLENLDNPCKLQKFFFTN